jgi:hypothetical protein
MIGIRRLWRDMAVAASPRYDLIARISCRRRALPEGQGKFLTWWLSVRSMAARYLDDGAALARRDHRQANGAP